MPLPHHRANITYPQNAGRAQGFECPFKDCGMEHSTADCSIDVTLNKMVEVVKVQMAHSASNSANIPLRLDERLNMRNLIDTSIDVMPRSRVLHGSRIVSAFTMADMGELDYSSELSFTPLDPDLEETIKSLDVALAGDLREIIRGECECQVCYGLMVDPLTTACGHTFCRKCVARVLDHSTLCPACRRPLPMRPGATTEPSNKRMSHAIEGLLTDELAARIVAVEQEETLHEDGWMPLFPCTLAYPAMPTFLHIFEPRYRLMIRRVLESGSRKFGIIMYNARGVPQGSLGRSVFMQYGTVLHISRIEVLPDGRSILETHGLYRFRALESSMLDGYIIGRIQRIDDMPLAEEEAAEALETRGPVPVGDNHEARISHMSTQALLQYNLDFVARARTRSERWLHDSMLTAYGQPPTDPAIFPYWFASILPIAEDEKYLLLPTTSVRERLKMTARWIRVLEEARCARIRVMRLARPLELEVDEDEASQQDDDDSTVSTAEPETPEAAETADAQPATANSPQAFPSDQSQQQQ
ncbi:hypothetical protein H2198_005025 [Neophaeococcomyces mojaviensis]|uniref:Uncharacterized protein n=1 Tax=Neophaeococcomyces mojaviensis TaxID=3383035 RepID=A0ACC3A6W9_9EURO|nr:hypothetical protein H2198_005025 [Knufia sp. JES_112]